MNKNATGKEDKLQTLRMLCGKCAGVISSIERMKKTEHAGVLSAQMATDFDQIRETTALLYPSCEPFLPASIPVDEYNSGLRCCISVDEIDMYYRQMVKILESAISDISSSK